MKVSQQLKLEGIQLLKSLISCPSFSGEEEGTAKILVNFLAENGIQFERLGNNIWAKNLYFDPDKPSLLLNSHHDTVRPNAAYSRDPFVANLEKGKLFGLGSNDAGGSLVSLLTSFLFYYREKDLAYNLIFAASAEEENSGPKGMRMLFDQLPPIAFAIVGEPTQMEMAIAEKGLLVLDAVSTGVSGHAAHGGENSIYKAMKDIKWFEDYRFPKQSDLLGDVHMQVTQITAGKQHNAMPVTCSFVVDVRVTDCYSNQEILKVIQQNTDSKIQPRSVHLNASAIAYNHPMVLAGKRMGKSIYGSHTLSDQALMDCPSLKIGPGDTKRSHTADEYIYMTEIEEAMDIYVEMLKDVLFQKGINESKKEDYEIVG